MLNSESRPTNPAAAAAATAEVVPLRKKSWIIGLACSRFSLLAVLLLFWFSFCCLFCGVLLTLLNRTTHSSQNCGVLMALPAETLSVVTRDFCLTDDGSQPAGFQSSAGTRMMFVLLCLLSWLSCLWFWLCCVFAVLVGF